VHAVDRLAPSLAANAVAAIPLKAPAAANPLVASPVINSADVAVAAELLAEVAVDPSAQDQPRTDKEQTIVVATLTDPSEVLAEGNASAQVAAAAAPDAPPDAAADTVPDGPAIPGRIEIVGECLVAEACIDQFLWALYERTPKLDTIKESERRKVSVRNKKGKMVKVTKTFTRLVNNDFTWKDPKAAERIKMSMIDYVIGGMEKSFKLKLFRMLYAAENAGLSPGITSAFRDDYRQSIASGLKAGERPLLSRRQYAWGLWTRARGRYRQRQGRITGAALGFDRSPLEMGRHQRQGLRRRPSLSRPRSAACRTARRPGICLSPRRGEGCGRQEVRQAGDAGQARGQTPACRARVEGEGRLRA
jgi:hypothetical protein